MKSNIAFILLWNVIVFGSPVFGAENEAIPKVEKGVRQLFLDDYLVDSQTNVVRTVHQPRKHPGNPVLKREHPWERNRVMVYGTVFYDSAAAYFKAWYMNIPAGADDKITVNGQRRPGHATLLSYATSKDGVVWEKPFLHLIDFAGSKENNMIAPDLYNPEGFSVLHEPGDADPERRYKAFYWDHGRGPLMMHEGREIYGEGPTDGMHVAFSPDGIHWKPHAENPVLKVGSDSGQCVLYDPRLRRYVAFSRLGFGRKVARTESVNFIHWTKPELVLQPDKLDGPNTQFYGISVDLYENVYIGMLWMFWIESGNVGRIDFQLCHSRDGKKWLRDPERRVFLANGPEGAWDAGDMRAACRSVILPDKVLIYYTGSVAPHGKGGTPRLGMDIGLATLRRDGWASLNASATPGIVLTKPVALPDGVLHVNADAANGSFAVEILQADGKSYAKPLKSTPIKTDVLAAPVVFKKSQLATLTGQSVRLKFTMRNAKLFSFWFQ